LLRRIIFLVSMSWQVIVMIGELLWWGVEVSTSIYVFRN